MKLSIAIPSNRDFGGSYQAIDSAYSYHKTRDVELSVSNNSDDPNKINAYQGHYWMQNSKPCGMIENFYKAFNATTGDFVLLMGDDDRIFSLNNASFDVANDVVGIHPNVVAFTAEHGMIKGDALEIDGKTAIHRVDQFGQGHNGSSLLFFSFWRRDIIKSIMDLWFNHHPTKGTYCDWAVVNALVSSGKVIKDTSSIYCYDFKNWIGDQEEVDRQIEQSYLNSGLTRDARKHAAILHAIDSFIFINRKDSPVSKIERIEAARSCIGDMDWNNALEMLNSLDLGDKYKKFYLHAIGEEWGCL